MPISKSQAIAGYNRRFNQLLEKLYKDIDNLLEEQGYHLKVQGGEIAWYPEENVPDEALKIIKEKYRSIGWTVISLNHERMGKRYLRFR